MQNQGQPSLRRDEGDFPLQPGDIYRHDAATDHQFQFSEAFEHIALRIPKAMARQRWSELRHVRCMMFEGRGRPVNRLILSLSQGLLVLADDLTWREVSAAISAAFEMFVTSVNARDGSSTTAHILNLRLDRCAADLRRPGAWADRISELAYA